MNHMEHDHLSRQAKDALQSITHEVIRPTQDPPHAITPLALGNYKALCGEMLDMSTALSDKILQQGLDYIAQDSNLKQHFAPSNTYCLVVMPCGTYGAPLEEGAVVHDGAHMRILVVNQRGETVAGFSQKTTHMFHIMPREVQSTAFTIPPYANPNPNAPATPADRAAVAQRYEAAFKAIRALLK